MDSEKDIEHSERLKHLRQAMYSRSLSKDLRMRPRRELHEVDYGVPDDFHAPEEAIEGSMVAPKTLGTARSIAWWFLIGAAGFFVIALLAFLAYFLVGSGSAAAAPGNIDIAVRGPLSVVGGEPSQFQVIVTNRNRVPLELADLIVRYPLGTRSSADFLTDLPEQRISLGTIEAGGQRQGTVSAVLMGKEGDKGTIRAELEYRISNSNAVFASEKDYGFTFTTAPITVALEGNQETISGQRVAITATIRSDSSMPLRDVIVEADYPFGFTPETLTPEPIRDKTWELGDLAPGDTRTIVLRGTLVGQETDERIFKMRAGTRKVKQGKGIDAVLSETAHHIAIARPFLGVSLAVNKDSGDEAVTVSAADTVNVTIEYVNNLSVPITNAVLVARLTGLDVEGATFETNEGFYRSADKTVLFDKTTTRGELAELKPGSRGAVSFSFTVPDATELTSLRESQLQITVHAAGKRLAESGVPETLQSSVVRAVKLASDVRVIGQAFYYQNPFGSTGPLPPKVDQETTYALVLTVANTSNEVRAVKVRALLPPYVRWVGVYSPSQERLTFNAADGTVSWDLGTVLPGVGVGSTTPRQVAFAVGLTPSSSQLGEQPALLQDITLQGKDAFTGRDVSATSPEVTTNLVDDPGFSTTEAAVER